MDPWLESLWADVHHTIISTLRHQIFSQLPAGLYAAIEENVYVVDAEPVRLTFPSEPIVEGHIEIRDLRAGNPLITVIEVMSPTNKLDARGRAAYAAKRDSYVAAGINILEIDLIRTGEHLISVPARYLELPSVAPYKCSIRRANVPTHAKVDYFPISLRQRLPRIHLPLRPADAEIVIDLQEPIRIAYEEGGFGIRIDYAKPPEPPLSTDDAAWAAALLAAK
jgi:hypothetical protein